MFGADLLIAGGEGLFGGWRLQGAAPKREREAGNRRTIFLALCEKGYVMQHTGDKV